jgi:hypothetical protein
MQGDAVYCYNKFIRRIMPGLEKTLLDRFVNGAFLGKRKMGRPIKYNIKTKGRQGWIELVFNP